MDDGNNPATPVSVNDAAQDLPEEVSSAQQIAELNQVSDTPSKPAPMPIVATPDEAADSDLIEKEWVNKAKQIVEHTKDDPYEQQRVIGKFKADYMKKRYDKDIKVSDS